jgi:hypothetical protein
MPTLSFGGLSAAPPFQRQQAATATKRAAAGNSFAAGTGPGGRACACALGSTREIADDGSTRGGSAASDAAATATVGAGAQHAQHDHADAAPAGQLAPARLHVSAAAATQTSAPQTSAPHDADAAAVLAAQLGTRGAAEQLLRAAAAVAALRHGCSDGGGGGGGGGGAPAWPLKRAASGAWALNGAAAKRAAVTPPVAAAHAATDAGAPSGCSPTSRALHATLRGTPIKWLEVGDAPAGVSIGSMAAPPGPAPTCRTQQTQARSARGDGGTAVAAGRARAAPLPAAAAGVPGTLQTSGAGPARAVERHDSAPQQPHSHPGASPPATQACLGACVPGNAGTRRCQHTATAPPA